MHRCYQGLSTLEHPKPATFPPCCPAKHGKDPSPSRLIRTESFHYSQMPEMAPEWRRTGLGHLTAGQQHLTWTVPGQKKTSLKNICGTKGAQIHGSWWDTSTTPEQQPEEVAKPLCSTFEKSGHPSEVPTDWKHWSESWNTSMKTGWVSWGHYENQMFSAICCLIKHNWYIATERNIKSWRKLDKKNLYLCVW